MKSFKTPPHTGGTCLRQQSWVTLSSAGKIIQSLWAKGKVAPAAPVNKGQEGGSCPRCPRGSGAPGGNMKQCCPVNYLTASQTTIILFYSSRQCNHVLQSRKAWVCHSHLRAILHWGPGFDTLFVLIG
jgi:hypothetical protein